MIRQAISCDICGAEKRQTNHWFVAWERDGELRVAGWTARIRLRSGAKHLCGQACLHKLADDFMERVIAGNTQPVGVVVEGTFPSPTDTSLTATPCADEYESSARLISEPVAPGPSISLPSRTPSEKNGAPQEPRFASRSWHAEAWQRERERGRHTSPV